PLCERRFGKKVFWCRERFAGGALASQVNRLASPAFRAEALEASAKPALSNASGFRALPRSSSQDKPLQKTLSADSFLPIPSDDSNRLSYFRLSGEQT